MKGATKSVFITLILALLTFAAFTPAFPSADSSASTTSLSPDRTINPTSWNKTYGGTDNDGAWSVVQTSDGGYVLAGNTWSFDAGNGDSYIVKTDSDGNLLWNKTYGGTSGECAHSVIQTNDGGYALASYTWSLQAGNLDGWLIKTDSNGQAVWNKTYGRNSEYAWSVIQTSDLGYALAGYTTTFDRGSSDFWLVRTDSNGNMLWDKTYGGVKDEEAFSMAQTSDEGYVIVGYTGDQYSHATVSDFWVVRTDPNGNMLWNKTYGGTSGDRAWAVKQTSDGGFVIVGQTESYGAGLLDFWVVRTNADGDMLWNKTYGGTDREVAYSVLQTDDGGFLLAGYSMSFGAGWGDVWLVETDSKGNLLWNKTYGGIYGDGANSIIQTSDGSFLLAGYTTLPASRSDCWLLKVQIPMIPVISTHDYSEVWHTQDFIINLSSNVPTQVSQTYYTINGGPVKTVSVDGQPKIATDGLNSLEYWTVDTRGSEETPHKTLTNIKLDKTIPEGSLVINTGAASTTSTSVTLTLTYADNGSGINQVRYSNDGAIWSPWESASQSKAWTLNSGDGQKTVYYQISDNAGLASTYLSTINLTAPTQTANPTSYPSSNPTTPPTQKPVTNPTASPTMNPSPIPELPFITVLPLVVIIPLVATAVLRKKKKVSGVTR